jgi:hypothetical protein
MCVVERSDSERRGVKVPAQTRWWGTLFFDYLTNAIRSPKHIQERGGPLEPPLVHCRFDGRDGRRRRVTPGRFRLWRLRRIRWGLLALTIERKCRAACSAAPGYLDLIATPSS